jgi:hypothetical protein
VGGAGFYYADQEELWEYSLNDIPNSIFDRKYTEPETHHTNLYLYTNIFYPENVIFTVGGSVVNGRLKVSQFRS